MKQKYGNHGSKKNKVAAYIKQSSNIEKKLQEATIDGVRYGLIAMEAFDTAYSICFGLPSTLTQDQIDRRSKLIQEFSKKITEAYVPMSQVPELLYDMINKELNINSSEESLYDTANKKLYIGSSATISSVEWLKDSIVNNDPRLGAYF